MDIVATLMSNPAVQAALLGTGVKVVVDQLKRLFKKVDENGVPEGYKMPVQLMVLVCSGLAAMGDLALKGQLSTYDPNLVANFLTTVVPVFAGAIATHFGGKVVLEKTLGRDTVLEKK